MTLHEPRHGNASVAETLATLIITRHTFPPLAGFTDVMIVCKDRGTDRLTGRGGRGRDGEREGEGTRGREGGRGVERGTGREREREVDGERGRQGEGEGEREGQGGTDRQTDRP